MAVIWTFCKCLVYFVCPSIKPQLSENILKQIKILGVVLS